MTGKQKPATSGRLINVKTGMDALDVLEERLDRIADRLNALWDRVVGVDDEGLVKRNEKNQ